MNKSLFSEAAYYKPYTYKGLSGRYIHMPAATEKAKRTFVILYGQHATLERIEPIVKALTRYGDVYAVDNPGFGGMDAAYKIKEHPTLEFYSGHLKHFISEYIPADRQLTLMGISYGFQIIANTLGEDKELCSRVEMAISFVGFVSYRDFDMPLAYSLFLKSFLSNIGHTWLGGKILNMTIRPSILKLSYFIARPNDVKYKSLNKGEAKNYLSEQTWLWMVNDDRTHAATARDFWYKNDLTNLRIPVNGVHIGVPRDHLFRNSVIHEELEVMFQKMTLLELNLENHAPLDVDTEAKVSELFPATLKSMFMESRNGKAVSL